MSRSDNISDNAKILVLINSWPSKEHPYLVHLFGNLKTKFPNLQFLIFNKPGSVLFAEQLIGKQAVATVLSNAWFRWGLSLLPWKILAPVSTWIIHPLATLQIFTRLREHGYSFRKAIGQMLFFHALIGKKFELVYINALQTTLHISLPAFFKDTPVIASSRGQDFDLHPAKFDAVLKQINHLHVLGEYLEKLAMDRGFKKEHITQIPPAVLPVRKDVKVRSESQKVRIISVSRLYWIKGYSYALRAVRLLADKLGSDSFEYLIVGDGLAKEEMLIEINRLSLQYCVRLVGWKSQTEIDEYLAESDIFLLLSVGEGFNNAAMQAQQAGVPCVVSDAGGLPENVIHEETGFVVPRYDEKMTTEYLYKLVTDRELRKKTGNAARARMRTMFTLETQVEKYTTMFQKGIAQK